MIDITKDPDEGLTEVARAFLDALDELQDPTVRLAFTKVAIMRVIQGVIDGIQGGTNEQN